MEETIVIKDNTYRVKKMNAIELLALQTQVDYSSMKKAKAAYESLLEMLEVKVKDQWLPVKAEGQNVYFPIGIENDIEAIPELIMFITKYFKEVFQKSNESKSKTE